MEVFRDCKETTRINGVRIYLQATTIADIANTEGTLITNYSFGAGRHSRTTENPRQSTHAWPQQEPRPGQKSWKAWREAIQLTLSRDGKTQTLRQPLGEWIIKQEQKDRNGTGTQTQRQESCYQEREQTFTYTKQQPR
jgi:hypothetical protein